jgi:hypothetical protein
MPNCTDTKSPYAADYRKTRTLSLIDKHKQNYKNEHRNSREISRELHNSQCTSSLSENEVGNGMREDKINSSTFNNNGRLHLPRNITAVMYLPLSA